MLPRNCKFCQKEATYSPIDRMEELGVKIFFCYPCQAEYLYWARREDLNPNPISFSLYVTIKEKMFRWTVMSSGRGQLWRVGKPGIPGAKLNEDMQTIFALDDPEIASITPANVESKIRSWLPFL